MGRESAALKGGRRRNYMSPGMVPGTFGEIQMKSSIIVALISAAAAAPSHAELWKTQIIYQSGMTSVNPAAPSCKVKISALFNRRDYAFAAGQFNVQISSGAFSSVTGGQRVRGGVRDIIVGQIHFPPAVLANPANPLAVWEGIWTTSNFTTRKVKVTTSTTRFDTYPSMNSPQSVSRLASLQEGLAYIKVNGGIPAPGTGALLGASALVAVRRRRARA